MPKSQKESLKEHAKAVQERLKKLKSGSSPPKSDVKKSSTTATKGGSKGSTKKT